MDIKTIYSKAPTRIDLAGGTVDIWPLYLMLDRPVTLNLGINLYAEAHLEFSTATNGQKTGVTLRTEDQNQELTLDWSDFKSPMTLPSSLELHAKLMRFFLAEKLSLGASDSFFSKTHLRLSTRAQAPAGSGLGGSSTLSVALAGALATWARGTPVDPLEQGERLIEVVRDVESTVIQVPAGLQDYYGAMYGGLQSLKWKAGQHERTYLPEDLIAELNDRLLLFYSGQSRNSGINNWALFKDFIDRRGSVRAQFEKITQATQELEAALLVRDWQRVGEAIAAEWSSRKTLAIGITTSEIDQAFAEAQKLAPLSGKVCGAGGGGCFFVYLPVDSPQERKKLKQEIQELFTRQGIRTLAFSGVPRGLEVQVR